MPKRHKTQEARILEILVRAGLFWTSAVEFSEVALQYGRAIHSLRRTGLRIENKIEIDSAGVRHGFFRLARGMPATTQHPATPAASDALFTSDELERCALPQDEPVSRFEAARMRRRR